MKMGDILGKSENWRRIVKLVMDMYSCAERTRDGALMVIAQQLADLTIALLEEEAKEVS